MGHPQPVAIVSCCPQPPAQVRHALVILQIVRAGDPDAIAELGDIGDLPRPWEPATCTGELRQQVWLWCDDVARWINRDYAWRPTTLIPGCWPRHPHIARELPVLACLYHAAADSAGPELLEEWHRHTLPLFLDRLTARLGESSCRTGKHQEWPAATRYDAFTSPNVTQDRHDLFHSDTHPPRQLGPAEFGRSPDGPPGPSQ